LRALSLTLSCRRLQREDFFCPFRGQNVLWKLNWWNTTNARLV
jgi:hypothetical protein